MNVVTVRERLFAAKTFSSSGRLALLGFVVCHAIRTSEFHPIRTGVIASLEALRLRKRDMVRAWVRKGV